MSRWFRFYDDAINDPKILKLSDNLFRVWVGILCAASKNNGVLLPLEDLALVMRTKPEKLKSAIESLIKSGLVDEVEAMLKPHNWDERQYKSDSSAERMKRHRDRRRDVTVTVQNRTDTDTDTEQKKDAAPSSAHVVSITPSPEKIFFDQAVQFLGPDVRSLAAKLLKAKGNNVLAAHQALLAAVQKSNPREYLGAIIRGRESTEDLRARGEAW